MSHVTEIESTIKSLDALKAACQRLGLQWMEGQKTYRWYGHWVGDYPKPEWLKVEDLGHCEHAIRVPGATYEIGIIHRNGEIKLLWDFWQSGGLEAKLGKQGGKLKQAIAIETAKIEARRKGFKITEQKENVLKRALRKLGVAVGVKQETEPVIRMTLTRG